MNSEDGTIEHVSDTALWVAYYRALETERPDALFRDPYARTLIGTKGEKISKHMGATSKYTQWSLVIRTVLIDRFIEDKIAQGVDTIVNLGAGLDTRPYRMNLPASLNWVEVDHPHMIEYKTNFLDKEKPRCKLERAGIDLADDSKRRSFLQGLSKRSSNILVITEGVLPYLTVDQVSDLSHDLHDSPSFRFWIAEYFDKEVYRYLQTPMRSEKMKKAPFVFFPDDWLGFFKERGWVPDELKYIGEETEKLGRKTPMPWWAPLFFVFSNKENRNRYKRYTGFAVFKRVAITSK